jgi:NAD(P)-dependent dehydrogenase (short-subunit alcohol dehydrogenase family)
MAEKRIILITGATNGIGFDTAVFLAADSASNHIIMGARSPEKASIKLQEIQAKSPKGSLSSVQLDTNSDASIAAAVAQIQQDFGRLDILINNAGVCPENGTQQWTSREQLRTTFETNVYGPMILTEAAIPLLKASSNPMVINVTSGLGSIAGLDKNLDPNSALYNHKDVRVPGYRMSKAALNMLTAYQSKHLTQYGFKIWAYCPGFVVTDLQDDRKAREELPWCESSETSAQGILDILRGERDANVGKFVTKRGGEYPW